MKLLAISLFLITTSAFADSPAEKAFNETVGPVLRRDCLGCHGEGQVLAKLDLRTRDSMLRGGLRGPAIQPGDANSSLLVQALEGKGGLAMPPGGAAKRLSLAVLAAFRTWIDGGAPWVDAKESSSAWSYTEADTWALRPLRAVKPLGNSALAIDAVLNAKLAERKIDPAPPADRATLIRRATLDLTGLPPTPQEIDAFVRDKSAGAWGKVVDRLLASSRYGEHWARHWLDVVRYSDSSGYSNDFERPNAWRYRDYVIRSFNADKPYDQFIREQMAGDEIDPSNPEYRIATGFLRAGPWEHTAMSVEAVTRQMWLDDVTSAIGVTFLGLTVGCARCHDHKFDPIPTKDYYRLQAVFASTEFARPRTSFLSTERPSDPSEQQRLKRSAERAQARLSEYRRLIRERLAKKRGLKTAAEVPETEMQAAMQDLRELSPEEYEEFKLHQKHLQLYKESLDRFEPKAFAVSSGPLDGSTDGGPALKYPKAAEYKPGEVRILAGGSLQSAGDKVEPGVLSAVEHYARLTAPEIPATIEGRRIALAEWIANPANPLTARVMVNRIWQYHFGTGLAADANNFGKMGRKPSHPELLDWLAKYFIDQKWSVKAVHRQILMSSAYQRSSSHPDNKAVRDGDPSNALLAYFPPRRVEAEVLRDNILFVSGELSAEAGGPGGFPQINQDVARQPRHAMGSLQPAYHASPEKRVRNRRSVYMFQQRALMDPFVEVFNGANPDFSCERREASTVPTQAFTLMNSEFVHDMALAFAAKLSRSGGAIEAQVRTAFKLALGRSPNPSEVQNAVDHWKSMIELHRRSPAPPKADAKPIVHMITSELTGEQFQFIQQDSTEGFEPNLAPADVTPEVRALADVTLALLNSNEFVYVY